MARLSLHHAPAWIKALQGNLRGAALAGLRSAAHRTVQYIVAEVIPGENPQPVDRGMYRAGWRARDLPDGAMVTNTVPWAPIVEYGARAENIKIGRKMIDALAEWIRRKGIGSTRTRTGKVKKVTKEDARAIAWAIAMSMKKRGIFNRGENKGGLRVFEKASRKIPVFIREEILREIRKKRIG